MIIRTRRDVLKTGALAASSLLSFNLPAQARRPMPDVIVVLPGITGSVLRKNGKDVWALSGSALISGLKTLGGSIEELTLTGDSDTAEALDDGVVASSIFPDTHLIPGLWKIDGYTRLAEAIGTEFLLKPGENYFEFAYDWRRDNRAAARRLDRLSRSWLKKWRETSGNANAKLILVAHSMGGLVSRYFLEVLGGWRETRSLVTFGTPYRGSLNALNFLANGMKKTLGPITLVDLSRFLRSCTSVYQLLPIYPCYDPGTGKLLRLTEASGIPNVNPEKVRDAYEFHEQIRRAAEQNQRDTTYLDNRYTIHPIVGTFQQTFQIGRQAADGVRMVDRHPKFADIDGDGTVPQTSATPIESQALTRQQRIVYISELHGSLQNSSPVLVHLRQILAEPPTNIADFRGPSNKRLSLHLDDVYSTTEPVRIAVGCDDAAVPLTLSLMDAVSGRQAARKVVPGGRTDSRVGVDLGILPEGSYRVRLAAADGASATDVFLAL